MSAQTLTRVFKLGATELDDPAPGLPAKEAMALYGEALPVIKSATLGPSTVEGDRLVFEILKPEGKTKG